MGVVQGYNQSDSWLNYLGCWFLGKNRFYSDLYLQNLHTKIIKLLCFLNGLFRDRKTWHLKDQLTWPLYIITMFRVAILHK